LLTGRGGHGTSDTTGRGLKQRKKGGRIDFGSNTRWRKNDGEGWKVLSERFESGVVGTKPGIRKGRLKEKEKSRPDSKTQTSE